MSGPGNVESLLREALSPVEPPADLASRVTSRLQSISDHAADELERASGPWHRAGTVHIGPPPCGPLHGLTGSPSQLAKKCLVRIRAVS